VPQTLTCDEKSCRHQAQYFYIIIPTPSEIKSVLELVQQLNLSLFKEEIEKPRLPKYCWRHNAIHLIPGLRRIPKQEYLSYFLVEKMMNI